MLHIIPIQSKKEQKAIAEKLGESFSERAFSYLAVDEDEDGEVTSVIGFMQFTLGDDAAQVLCLREAAGSDDLEAMQILARTAFSFIHRIGLTTVQVPKDASDERLMSALRMEDCGDFWELNIAGYFAMKCEDRVK